MAGAGRRPGEPVRRLREAYTARGPADYLLYVDRKLVGVVEAKREGTALRAVEKQSARYAAGLTASQQMQAWRMPLPFRYETTATETHFTNTLNLNPWSREVFSFHRPETLARWMRTAEEDEAAQTLHAKLHRGLPELVEKGLRPAQARAVRGFEASLQRNAPRSLIQMATGAGKTYTAVTSSYRLLRHAGAYRILFLVDRNNLGKQAYTEFTNYVTPDDGRKFSDLLNVQRLANADMLGSSEVAGDRGGPGGRAERVRRNRRGTTAVAREVRRLIDIPDEGEYRAYEVGLWRIAGNGEAVRITSGAIPLESHVSSGEGLCLR
ncbi:DEAD/DEAH box helicase family protein [Sphaerisporangium sp. NPDC088356]|uniref:DEAD/DEAH box helicase family protein n=1 Tax=Sphaerisporangium sp. NPDC088356 TaxID=3154871 RepID=UPI00344732C3